MRLWKKSFESLFEKKGPGQVRCYRKTVKPLLLKKN